MALVAIRGGDFAKTLMGATVVIGTCSARNIDYVESLGADQVLDYNYLGGLSEQLKDAPVSRSHL